MNVTISTITPTSLQLFIDLDTIRDPDRIQDAIDAAMEPYRATGEAQEWEVVDHEDIPKTIAAATDPAYWIEYAEAYDEHGDPFMAFFDNESYCRDSIADAVEAFEERYRGEYDSKEAFAEELLDETGEINEIPEHLRYYFDYEAYARDLFISDVYELDAPGGIYVFWNN